jgi:hypothetical protein
MSDRLKNQRGFALAPILYMLGLIGVTAGVLFTGYSQVIRSNIAISDSIAVKGDLNAAAQTLAGSSKLGSDGTTLCPPAGSNPGGNCPTGAPPNIPVKLAALSGTNLPTIYSGGSAVALTQGAVIGATAKEVGIFAVGAGIKQLDPWGHQYIYCRWENLTTSGAASPAILVITAGADGELETNCDAATATSPPVACNLHAGCDDSTYFMNVSTTVNHSTLWTAGTTTVGSSTLADVTYGASPLTVDANGNLTVPGTSALAGAVSAGGTLAVTGTSQLTGVVTTTGAVNVGGNLTGPSGGTLAVGNNTTIAGGLTTTGAVGIGTASPNAQLQVRAATNENLYVGSGYSLSGAVSLGVINDANSANVPLEIHASTTVIPTGQVGIGTTTPQSALDVAGGVSIGAGYAGATAAPTNGAIIQGSVGIGATSPPYMLTVAPGSTGSGLGIGWNHLTGSVGETDFYNYGQGGTGGFAFYNYASPGAAYPTTGAANLMTILSSGAVGIGTTTPASALSVNGGVAVGSYASTTTAPSGWMLVSGQVGIGTTLPGAVLDAQPAAGKDVLLGGGTTTGSELKLTYNGVAHFSIYNSGNHAITFADTSASGVTNTLGTPIMTITNGGVVTATQFSGSGAGLTSATVPVASINASGSLSSGNFLQGNGTWAPIALGTSTTGTLPVSNLSGTPGGATNQYNLVNVNAQGLVVSGSMTATTQWITNGTSIYYNLGNVGIGSSSPVTSLDLSQKTDGISLPELGAAANSLCTGIPTGTIRYNTTLSVVEFCNGTNWLYLASGGGGGCSAPTSFPALGNVTGATVNTSYVDTNGAITPSGCNSTLAVMIGGASSAQVSINGGPWATSGVISPGQTLQVRMTSSLLANTMLSAVVFVGTASQTWTVTTAVNCTITIGTVCADGSIYAGLTPDGSAYMYAQPCDAPGTGSIGACVGTRAAYAWSAGISVATGVNNANTGRANTYTLHADDGTISDHPYSAADYCYNSTLYGHSDWYLPAYYELSMLMSSPSLYGSFGGGNQPYWTSTEANTSQADQYTSNNGAGAATKWNGDYVRCVRNSNTVTPGVPNAFSFTNQSNAATGQTIVSNAVALSGSFANATVTCGTGCTGISINGGAFVAGPVTGVNSGATLAIEQTSSSSYGTPTTASVTVGSTTSSAWQVTTMSSNPCASSPAVGAVCADGTIYAGLTPDGTVAMYTTPCDAGMSGSAGNCTGTAGGYKWSSGTVATNITNQSTGRFNTLALYNDNSVPPYSADTPYQAANYCYTLNSQGHSDWYLPAWGELSVLHAGYAAIGGWSAGLYVDSNESPGGNAQQIMVMVISTGLQQGGNTYKSNTGWGVRCVRNNNAAPTNVANAFSFNNVTTAALNSTVTSNTVTLGGNFTNLTATCGSGCTGISLNGAAFVAGPVPYVSTGMTLAIQQTSPSSNGLTGNATVTVGTTTSGTWTVTTSSNCTVTLGAVCADGSIYAGNTPDGGVPMYTTPCDAGMTGSAGLCTGTRSTYQWSRYATISTGVTNVNTGRLNTLALHNYDSTLPTDQPYQAADYCYTLNYLGHSDWYLPAFAELGPLYSGLYLANSALAGFTGNYYYASTEVSSSNAYGEILTSGATTGVITKNQYYLVRCVRNNNTAPTNAVNAFSFTNVPSAPLSTAMTSNAVTLGGGFTGVTATCGSGCTGISINGGAMSAGPVTGVNSGNTIAIRQTSPSGYGSTANATVTVGTTTSSTWTVTTPTVDPCTGTTTPPTVGQVCTDGSIYAGQTLDGSSMPMYAAPCDYGMTGSAGSCTGTRVTLGWGTYGTTTGLTNANTGKANTLALHSIGGAPAANTCYALSLLGYSDWYLPAINELNLMAPPNYTAIGGFSAGAGYWSSTEAINIASWMETLSTGVESTPSNNDKNNLYNIRCVRHN